MIIKELTPHRIDEVMELFHTCFDDDPYYASHFSSPKDKITSTYPTMLWALEQGYCLGVFDYSKLIGFYIAVDLQKYLGRLNSGAICFGESFHDKLLKCWVRYKDVLYVAFVGVTPEYREMGIFYRMLHEGFRRFPDHTFVGDADNPISKHVCEKTGGIVDEVEQGYWSVVWDMHDRDDTTYIL